MSKKDQIDRDGWILVRNVFAKSEIESFRERALASHNHKGDILSNENLKDVILDDRVINLFKEVLGTDTLYYFGDSTVSLRVNSDGFHKDSRDRHKKESEEWSDRNYSLIRMGIYLQDHSEHSGGLCLRHNSHLTQSVHQGKIINVKSKAGDVIMWKLTTTHSANARVLTLLPNLAIHPRIARRIPQFLLQKTIMPRMAFFLCFGLEDKYAKRLLELLQSRSYAVERWKHTHYNSNQVEEMRLKGVKVLTNFGLEQINEHELNEDFKQL